MRKLDIVKSKNQPESTVKIAIDDRKNIDALGSVKSSIDKLYDFMNQKEDYDFDKLKEQLEILNKTLDLSDAFSNLQKSILESRVDTVTVKDLSDLIDAVKSNKPLPFEVDISSLEKAIISVEQRIQESSLIDQAPENFQPIRRVVKVGNKLIYDDNPTSSGGRGGGSGQTSLILGDSPISTSNPLPVEATLEVGDISIGAIEIKNSTDETRATVGSNGLHVEVRSTALPSTPIAFVTTVTTAGTRVQLASNTLTNGAILQAPSTNTGLIYVGVVTVSSTVYGAELQPGQSTSIAVSNTNAIYIDSSVNGDKCAALGS